MPSIYLMSNPADSVDLMFLKGAPQFAGMTLEEITRPGVDGHEFRQQAKRSAPTRWRGIKDCQTLADATAAWIAIKAMQGQIIGFVDDFGDTYENAVLLEVGEEQRRKIANAAGAVLTVSNAVPTALLEVDLVILIPYVDE